MLWSPKCGGRLTGGEVVTRSPFLYVYVTLLILVVVGVDILFFRQTFWGRLFVNIGIVMVFVAFYLRFVHHP
jgi:uncharacterized membrane protein